MGDKTGIEWTDATWNPLTGCQRVSPGCTNCYAERLAGTRMRHLPTYGQVVTERGRWNGKTAEAPSRTWTQPKRWSRPRRIFVCSMSDLFYEGFTDAQIARVFAVMAEKQRHTFMVLTKRASRMRQLIDSSAFVAHVVTECVSLASHHKGKAEWAGWPLPNVLLGVSAEDQARWDERVPKLLATPAAGRYVSVEPLVGPVDTGGHDLEGVQLIVGGESGPGARPMHPDWVRQLLDQGKASGALFFFKQWGEWLAFYDRDNDDPDWRNVPKEEPGKVCRINHDGGHGFHGERVVYMRRVGKKAAGRQLDGREWSEQIELQSKHGQHG